MNSNTPFTKDKNKLILSKKTNVPFIKIPKIFNPFTISNSQRGAKDISIPLQFQILKEERKIFHMKIILYLNGY